MEQSKVSILLSIYKPNETFLRKQLDSLNNQSYQNIELIVWNDCPDVPLNESLFKESITNFPYKLYDQHINLGYAKAFEKLITLASGKYISFCDQDDIWEHTKVSECVERLEEENGVVVVCDKVFINEMDQPFIPSGISNKLWKSETWSTGDDITNRAIFTSYSPGMAILALRDRAERYIPFPEKVAHDRWIMAVLSACGKAVKVKKPLVQYRRYQKNVTGTLYNINCKKDYYIKRADNTEMINCFERFFPKHPDLENIKKCNAARVSGNPFRIFKYREYIPDIYFFEILLAICPNFLFKFFKKILFN